MRHDQETYGLATRVSLAGFVLQLIASLTVFILARTVDDHVTWAASFYMFWGLPVWATLAILFHQHRLERIEAVEAEQLAAQVEQSGSIFEYSEEGMDIAARRLRWMHLYLVPAVSLFVGLGLMATGWFHRGRLVAVQDLIGRGGSEDQLRVASPEMAIWAMVITAVLAIVTFIFSRYVSGMSQQVAWRTLRGGASTIVGGALLSALLAIAHGFLFQGGNETGMRILATVVPWFMIAIGIEITANFVLNLYRPRRPGEIPRPAFDSRVLSMLAAPDSVAKSIADAINYQFGFEVTSTWFYQLASRQILPLIGLVILMLAMLNCVAVVEPHQQAIVAGFGKLKSGEDGNVKVYESGLVFKMPWQSVERFPVARVQQILVGAGMDDDGHDEERKPILWGQSHTTAAEDLIIVRPSYASQAITADAGPAVFIDQVSGRNEHEASRFGLLNADIPIQFKIKTGNDADGRPELMNYIEFTAGSTNYRHAYILMIAKRVVHSYLATMSIDDILGDQRVGIANQLRDRIQNELDARKAGIEIVFVGVSGLHPPVGNQEVKVADAFEEVLKAEQQKLAAVEIAQAAAIRRLARVAGSRAAAEQIFEAIEAFEALGPDDPQRDELRGEVEALLLEAGGEAAKIVMEAKADRWVRHMEQWGSTIRVNSRLLPYRAAPRLYLEREFLSRLSAALQASARPIICAVDIPNRITMDLEDDATSLDLQTSVREEMDKMN